MPIYLLMGMQAAGMIVDYFGTQNQTDLMNMGMKLQEAAFDTNLEQTRLETADASLQAMKELRKTLGAQIAIFAARGASTSSGSAASLLNESQANFNSDEKIRRLNMLGKENQLRGNLALSRLQNSSDVSKLWQGFASRTFNTFSTNPAAYSQGFGLTTKTGA